MEADQCSYRSSIPIGWFIRRVWNEERRVVLSKRRLVSQRVLVRALVQSSEERI